MKKLSEQVPKSEEGFAIRLHPRPNRTVTIRVPRDTLASLQKMAAGRDMSVEALIKLYVGQGLRQDVAKLLADRVLEKTAQVLTRHIRSEEEVSAILKEIRVEAVP